ncbi:MAG: response regulator [Planctomycetes bacterium]|nr:response regulator [Planctomycetota bacterium]NBO91785.1 response regulator [Planctomycetia bacterium]
MTTTHIIMLVEDNPADVMITQRAIRDSKLSVDLIVLRDGREAIDYLSRQGQASEAPSRLPDLILLDVNLPGMTGREVLERIRGMPGLPPVPVVVLTTSNRQEDIEQMYRAGANSYIQKPQEFTRFVTILRTIDAYWLRTALLPPR